MNINSKKIVFHNRLSQEKKLLSCIMLVISFLLFVVASMCAAFQYQKIQESNHFHETFCYIDNITVNFDNLNVIWYIHYNGIDNNIHYDIIPKVFSSLRFVNVAIEYHPIGCNCICWFRDREDANVDWIYSQPSQDLKDIAIINGIFSALVFFLWVAFVFKNRAKNLEAVPIFSNNANYSSL